MDTGHKSKSCRKSSIWRASLDGPRKKNKRTSVRFSCFFYLMVDLVFFPSIDELKANRLRFFLKKKKLFPVHEAELKPPLPWNTAQQLNRPSPRYRGSPDVWLIFFILPCKCALALFCDQRFTACEHSGATVMHLLWLWLRSIAFHSLCGTHVLKLFVIGQEILGIPAWVISQPVRLARSGEEAKSQVVARCHTLQKRQRRQKDVYVCM